MQYLRGVKQLSVDRRNNKQACTLLGIHNKDQPDRSSIREDYTY
jgi:hypothetical protein